MTDNRYQGSPCKRGHDGIRNKTDRHCVDCKAERTRAWYEKKGRKLSFISNIEKYGIDEAYFNNMLVQQGGMCAICSVKMVVSGRGSDGLTIDHDHAAGTVRGLLCNNCNRGIGMFKDSKELLINASKYL